MNNNSDLTIIALFVRVPVPGRVKTRLAADLGDVGAYRLYLAMVADILANLKGCGLPLYLFHDGASSHELPAAWRQAASKVIAQSGESIGNRMATAFAHCFAQNTARVILVGSDIPGLDAGIIAAAATALSTHDVALAPAVDGGYCLIGLRADSYQAEIFDDIPWSTAQVLRATLARCGQLRLKVQLLETLQDIDTLADLAAYRRHPAQQAVFTNSLLMSTTYNLTATNN